MNWQSGAQRVISIVEAGLLAATYSGPTGPDMADLVQAITEAPSWTQSHGGSRVFEFVDSRSMRAMQLVREPNQSGNTLAMGSSVITSNRAVLRQLFEEHGVPRLLIAAPRTMLDMAWALELVNDHLEDSSSDLTIIVLVDACTINQEDLLLILVCYCIEHRTDLYNVDPRNYGNYPQYLTAAP